MTEEHQLSRNKFGVLIGEIVETAYQPARLVLGRKAMMHKSGDAASHREVNNVLRPYGFSVTYWGYDKMTGFMIYKLKPIKAKFYCPIVDKVAVYHISEISPEEWLEVLLERLARDDYSKKEAAIKRKDDFFKWLGKNRKPKKKPRKRGRKKKVGRKPAPPRRIPGKLKDDKRYTRDGLCPLSPKEPTT